MSFRRLIQALAAVFLLSALGNPRTPLAEPSAGGGPVVKRMRFQVTTATETERGRIVLAESVIEGPPGTDFDIDFKDARFVLKAGFLTDLIEPDTLGIRATLDTKRFVGWSERKLPLYEEDTQKHALKVGLDEALVLLPFGGQDGKDLLKIEIVPSVVTVRLADSKPLPLKIDILKQAPHGSVNIRARKQPHRFRVEAQLLENGREVARGDAVCPLDEPGDILLEPTVPGGPTMPVRMTVNEYRRSRPNDEFTVNFDLFQSSADGRREVVGLNWAGAGVFGEPLTYDVTERLHAPPGGTYELRFNLRLADGEESK